MGGAERRDGREPEARLTQPAASAALGVDDALVHALWGAQYG